MLGYALNKLFSKFDETSSKPAFFIKEGYRHRTKPRYFFDNVTSKSGIIWQPEVYDVGKKLALELNCTNIIDIGCGFGEKLVKLYPQFNIFGIDYKNNFQYCKKKYSFGNWVEADFESKKYFDFQKEILEKSVFICSDVIEHLINPSNLLQNIKQILTFSPICIISTPERELTSGKNSNGPPPNRHHIREWTLSELKKYLESFNFKILGMGLTASNNENFEQKTIIAVLGNDKSQDTSMKLNALKLSYTTFLEN